MDQNSIPLARAAFREQFAEAMLNNGLSPDTYFEQVGLPIHDLDDPESLIPVKPFYLLANLIAIQEEIPDFGAQVAAIKPWHQVKSLTPLLCQCHNLEALLKTFCTVASTQRSGVKFVVEEDEGQLWFNSVGRLIVNNDIQMELYRITSMIQLVLLATGLDWHPEQIQLLMPRTKTVEACNLISKSHIAFSQEKSGISISADLLKLPVNINIPDIDTVQEVNHYDINTDFVDAMRQIVATYIKNKDLTIETIATATGIPVRTLQRRLRQNDINFTDLLNETKFNIAKDKLKNTSLTIMEIGFQLGYSYPANFTLAFHRWAGVSPSKYRKNKNKHEKK